MPDRPAPPRSVVSRITAILSTFLTGESHSVTEIARMTGLPVSTTHRIAADLAVVAAAAAERRTAATGSDPSCGGSVATPRRRPVLTERAARVVLTCARRPACGPGSAVLDDTGGWPTSRSAGRSGADHVLRAGATLPAHASARGQGDPGVLPSARHRAAGWRRTWLAFTPRTVNTPDRLRRALGIVRLAPHRGGSGRAGHRAQSDVAVPVFGCGGVVVAALELEVHDLGRRPGDAPGRAGRRRAWPVPRARGRSGRSPGRLGGSAWRRLGSGGVTARCSVT